MVFKPLMILLRDTRRRNTILIAILLFVLIGIAGITQFLRQINAQPLNASTQIETVSNIRSVPGGLNHPPSEEHTRLQKQQNEQKAQQAGKTGRSAIATIVDSFHLDQRSSRPSGKEEALQNTEVELPTSLKQESEVQAILRRQNILLSEQQTELAKQQIQAAMAQQINQLFSMWGQTSPQQTVTRAGEDQRTQTSNYSYSESQQKERRLPVLAKAGSILQAILLTGINSDQPGPVLAKIVEGDFKGARLVGTLSTFEEGVRIQFTSLNLPQVSHTLPISAMAIDKNTAGISLASQVDRHLVWRYGSLLAASFLEGYRLSVKPMSSYALNPTGGLLFALENIGTQLHGTQFSSMFANQFHKKPTIYVHSGTSIGVLLVADLVKTQVE